MPRTINEAVALGLRALGAMQRREGYFPLYFGSSSTAWQPCDPIFSTAYIMMGVGRLLPPIRVAHAVEYIASSRRSDGLWQYDPSLSSPPDADTTACALAALALDGQVADPAGDADLLRTFWRPHEGPFRTWRAEGAWSSTDRDDPVVNCNVLYALRLLGAPATNMEGAAATALVRRSVAGARYYRSSGAVALACRRGEIAEEAWPANVAAPPKDGLGLIQWFAATGREGERIIPRLLGAQRPDGSWRIAPWVTGAGVPTPFWGSPAITTALAIEALRSWPQAAT